MKIVQLKQRSKEWLQWRRNKIMASDSPIIMGLSKFKTIEELYNEKIKCYESVVNPWMQRGIDLEELALDAFQEATDLVMFPCVGEHKEIDWMAASFDGMTIEGDAIVEIKCPGKKDHDLALEGKVPEKYIPQLQHQMYVAGVNYSYYYSFDGQRGVIVEVPIDQEFIEKMIEKEFEFWQCLQTSPHTPTFTAPKTNPRIKRSKNATGAIP